MIQARVALSSGGRQILTVRRSITAKLPKRAAASQAPRQSMTVGRLSTTTRNVVALSIADQFLHESLVVRRAALPSIQLRAITLTAGEQEEEGEDEDGRNR